MTYRDQLVGERTDVLDRFTLSAHVVDSPLTPNERVASWLAERAAVNQFQVERVPLDALSGWQFNAESGNLEHDSGRFFSVEGVRVRTDRTWIAEWTQPIIVQPEIGVLGILVREFDGVLHCLMQAKMEPGNINKIQLTPTVQATRSNYLGVHRGAQIPYLDYFTGEGGGRTLVDALQSEQGAWFLGKRNRNMVVETLDDVPEAADFCWLTIGQIRRLLAVDHLVNMDTRTVLSCIPFHAPGAFAEPASPFVASVLHSIGPDSSPVHEMTEVLSWLTELRARRELLQRRVPLYRAAEDGWYWTRDAVEHRSGKYFRIVGINAALGNREVPSWTQPILAPVDAGLLALITKRISGTLHVLVQARADAGSLNGAEMAPTVHCQPANYRDLPDHCRPHYLDQVLSADPARIRYDRMQSEEGGRFLHAVNRYLIVEADEDFPERTPAEYRWMTLRQLTSLLTHCNYLNVELRSLIACLNSVW
ncbi:NDP-hexose 2,3-dehydratase family protein [Goodfellowiella coeruleoviolacea]|uniref:Oxidase EvaA n=1 Tax=Goodfellowiella coeruleoviolacea TaxID=334858 RepID=A0AAE3KJI7_9PSEU|nr:NDP-hexose 2,3-dehydratase family protein [Goodfellowiella coeruleoviolacea]MCP2170271.1 oxidase EvaA [Goodfellowiella coeruleoviolacea]